MTYNDAWPVDPPRNLELVAGELLRFELGPRVRFTEPLALVEHVLEKRSAITTGDGDGAGVMKPHRFDLVRQLDGVSCAFDVHPAVRPLIRSHVVDRREVEEVVNPLEHLSVFFRDPEGGITQIADDRHDPTRLSSPACLKLLQPRPRSLAHEHVDESLSLEQPLDEIAADESGRAGHEV